MTNHDDRVYLEHILECAALIRDYTRNGWEVLKNRSPKPVIPLFLVNNATDDKFPVVGVTLHDFLPQ
ncbi:MAG: hypothetical protein RLZZ148_1976 [Cyanobacteriota bacterium]